MKKIKTPKTVEQFLTNLETVILDVPLNEWAGVYVEYEGDLATAIETDTFIEPKSSSGCLLQQALGKKLCAMKGEQGGYAKDTDEFVNAAPFLKPYSKALTRLLIASDKRDVSKCIKETIKLAERVLAERMAKEGTADVVGNLVPRLTF